VIVGLGVLYFDGRRLTLIFIGFLFYLGIGTLGVWLTGTD